MKKPSQAIIQALAVTAEVCGTELSEAAAAVMCSDLAEYSDQAVLDALVRLRREHGGRLTLAAIISRIDDGRPGPEEAWAMYPKDEDETAVVTDEMNMAMAGAWRLLNDGDKIGARMAFKEAYEKIVANNRAAGISPSWTPTLGHYLAGREGPLVEAVKRGRLTAERAMAALPFESHPAVLAAAGQADHPMLARPTEEQIENRRRLASIIGGIGEKSDDGASEQVADAAEASPDDV